ncbi:MAG TPA: TonB family protein [Myxococcales bacterium]|nr:TonB family protein [Myxococcales bacterium]
MIALRGAWPAAGSIAIHGFVATLIGTVALRRPQPPSRAQSVQVEVLETRPRPPAPEKAQEPLPKPAPPKLAPRKLARATPPPLIRPSEPLPPPDSAPPPPSREAKTEAPPVVLPGISFESTTRSGGMAVAAGNTLYGDPGQAGRDPAAVKPYKAQRYASAAQVTELPRTLSCDSRVLEKYYPDRARRREFEGDVVLRLLIDGDGSVAKAELVSDPGEGLGAAGLRAIQECRFAGAKIGGDAVATTVPFTLHFTLR